MFILGAEVTFDNLNGSESDDSDEGEFSDDDIDNEDEEEFNEDLTAKSAEIVVPDIDHDLSNDQVPVAACTQPPSSNIPSPLSSSQLRSNDQEAVEIITEIQADDATKEPIDDYVASTPAKRIRLSADNCSFEKTF